MGGTTSTRDAWGAGLLLLAACASTPTSPVGFSAPLERYAVSSEFGPRRGGRHDGMDLRAPEGTPVYAAAGGRVVMREERGAFGKLVIIDHGEGLVTYYAHLGGYDTKRGRIVRAGEKIGEVGRTGNATGPHLHFELREGGRPIDPRRLVPF